MRQWKDIEGFEGLYQVSSDGQVKSLSREVETANKGGVFTKIIRERLLKPQIDQRGYLYVNIYKDNKMHSKRIHKLVASAFISNPNKYDDVHHKDHNAKNNTTSNLMWINKNEHNTIHSSEKAKKVYQYTLDGDLIKVWNSIKECGMNGFSRGTISDCCNGKYKQHKGYRWSFKKL